MILFTQRIMTPYTCMTTMSSSTLHVLVPSDMMRSEINVDILIYRNFRTSELRQADLSDIRIWILHNDNNGLSCCIVANWFIISRSTRSSVHYIKKKRESSDFEHFLKKIFISHINKTNQKNVRDRRMNISFYHHETLNHTACSRKVKNFFKNR